MVRWSREERFGMRGPVFSRFLAFLAAIAWLLSPIGDAEAQSTMKEPRILIAYFSHSGNTREIARQIQEVKGGDLHEILPARAYPTDYDAVVKQAKHELNAGFQPELKSKAPDLSAYDVIFVGSPNWWNTIAPPVMTFLSGSKLEGKTIVPFITHGGSHLGKSVTDVRKWSPGAKVLDGKAFWGRDAKDARLEVRAWLRQLDP